MSRSDSKSKILCMIGSMNAGGAETFLMKIYRQIDKEKYQLDFYVTQQNKGFYDDEISTLGGKIIRAIPKSKNPFKSFVSIYKTVKTYKYKRVIRISQHSLSSIDLFAAKLAGAKILVFRSSNSKTGGSSINTFLHFFFRPFAKLIPNIKLAPSHEAAEFMFGKNYNKNQNTYIIKNGIPVEDFTFSNQTRLNKRNELNFNNKFIVGHIGRLNKQKNHFFLIEVFEQILKRNDNSLLILVGSGELKNALMDKVEEKRIADKVIFLGVRSDIPQLLMAFDLMIFPSLFEGLPNVLIEAQATGLKCIVSDSISKEVKVSNNLIFKNIQDEPIEWTKEVDFNYYERLNNDFPDDYNIQNTVDFFIENIFKD